MSDSIRHFINLANGIINKEMPPVGPDQESTAESIEEAHDSKLMDQVIMQIKRDCDMGDYTAIEELLMSCPEDALKGFLSEVESVQEQEEKPYICVHADKGKYECRAKSSYEAAKKAAAHWNMKSTAGIDAHLATDESIQNIQEKKNCGCNQDPCITYGKQNEAIEEGACTYANPLMAGKTYTCCDCGDEMHVPTTTCQHDSHDETGSWWRDENGNGVPDLFESYKANVATLLKG